MSIFELATVLIYVTSVLTSTVNQSLDPDKNPPPALKKLFASSQSDNKNPTLLTATRSINNNQSTAVSDSDTVNQIITEGGVFVNSHQGKTQSSTTAAVTSESLSSFDKELPPVSREDISEAEEHEKAPSVVARKGVGEGKKTVGKKGVKYPDDSLDNNQSSTTVEQLLAKKTPNETKLPTEKPVVVAKPNPPVIEKTEAKISPNGTKLDEKTAISGNKSSNVAVLVVPGNPNNTVSHKRKPTSTTGEGDDDGKGMPSSPTETEIGMPRKVDYIVPIVITIMATPVLGIAAFVLYTRGRDCWDKRHYRRMDFLIDGMYND